MIDKHPLKQADIDLFRRSLGDVLPIKQDSINLQKPKPRSRSAQSKYPSQTTAYMSFSDESLPDEFQVGAADIIQFRRPGLQDRYYRKFKRGLLPVTAALDLHGLTLEKARMALDDFMQRAKNMGQQRCIRIIHGKGYGSRDGKPVIKQYIQKWLQAYDTVLAYSSCSPADGGTGAVYVLLKSGEK